MDRKTATLIGAAAAFATGPALAAPVADGPVTPVASSYAELLTPIPNAVERLRIADSQSEPPAELIKAQYVAAAHHHHHHHHHHHNRAWYMAHGYYWHGGAWVIRPAHHHHHHHHHHL
jgi:hypothetical protein